MFLEAIEKLESLRTLVLDSNEMRDDALWVLCTFVASNSPLKNLSLRDQDFTRRKALQNLFVNLRFNTNLVTLDVRHNPAVLNEYIFSAESFDQVASELREKNAGLAVYPFPSA